MVKKSEEIKNVINRVKKQDSVKLLDPAIKPALSDKNWSSNYHRLNCIRNTFTEIQNQHYFFSITYFNFQLHWQYFFAAIHEPFRIQFFFRTIVSSPKLRDFAFFVIRSLCHNNFMTLKQDAIFWCLVALTFQILSQFFFLIAIIDLKI